jgi:hypothetical protein
MYRKLTAVACCCLITALAVCQKKNAEIKFGDIKPEDFKPQYYSIDSSADAVNLYDVGSTKYEGNNQGWFSVVFKVHEKIRLLHKKSFDDLATVKIPLYMGHAYQEKLDDLQAATYNLEDGKVTATKVDKSSIFKDKDGDYQVSKFTFPNLKEGSIIEYTFTIIAPIPWGNEFIPKWSFQGSYPNLWSAYTIEVPQFFEFVVMSQGFLEQPVIDTATISADNFNVLQDNGTSGSQVYSIHSNTIKHTWAYKNVPAIKEEKYITALSNYIQKLEFQLSAHRFPDVDPKFFMHTWPETVEQLMKDEDFGQDLSKGNGWLKDDVKDAVQNETDALNKAKKIYAYVQTNYTCTDNSAIYLSQPLKKTEQTKKGNVVDINMLLIAMFRAAGLQADPVLLSTRDHGKTYDIYPLLHKFNYLIARIYVDADKTYLLDATDAILGFGHLKEECYNGNARVISTEPVLIDLSADSLRQAEVTSLFMSNGDDGKITGSYKHVMNDIQSEDMREKMKKTNQDDYFKDVKKSFSFDVDLDNKLIDSLKQPEQPVAVEYDLSFKPEGDVVYFTPVLGDGAYKENPFSAAQRFYPVEMPYCSNKTYILNMEIPTGYKVDELPKSARVSLNNTDGMFEYLIQQSGNNIQLRCTTKLNKATFEPDDLKPCATFLLS